MILIKEFEDEAKKRDQIIFGDYRPERYKMGGCARHDITYAQCKQLLDEGFIDPYENQNESPSTTEFMNAVRGYEDCVTFEVYAIGPERDDFRVTIEGIDIILPPDKADAFCKFAEEYHDADEFNVYTDDEGFHLRAWWD